ncbi:MAG: hypothetical protein JKY61_10235 [Planctomycetes bacterium]|nr:hypothetical protein [Planctomycetota bacterium]
MWTAITIVWLACLPSPILQTESPAAASLQEPTAETRTDWGLGESTRQMLIQRCGDCHNPQSDNRKAKRALLDIGDLASVTQDFVLAGNAEDSDLYYMIVEGDMPPPKSDVQAPSEQELALLHAWISSGAEPPVNTPVIAEDPSPAEGTPWTRYVSRTHPLWIHFPLALLPVAFLAAALARLFKSSALRTTALFCAGLAVPASIFSVASGWLHAAEAPGQAGIDLHRWLGVATAVTCAAAMLARKRPGVFLALLGLAAAIGGAAGHFGGRLTYGPDFFPW